MIMEKTMPLSINNFLKGVVAISLTLICFFAFCACGETITKEQTKFALGAVTEQWKIETTKLYNPVSLAFPSNDMTTNINESDVGGVGYGLTTCALSAFNHVCDSKEYALGDVISGTITKKGDTGTVPLSMGVRASVSVKESIIYGKCSLFGSTQGYYYIDCVVEFDFDNNTIKNFEITVFDNDTSVGKILWGFSYDSINKLRLLKESSSAMADLKLAAERNGDEFQSQKVDINNFDFSNDFAIMMDD